MGFPVTYMDWIQECISSPVYSINFNGRLEGFIPEAKGVRQGDPLSPCLFILCMEVLSKILNATAGEGAISYHLR